MRTVLSVATIEPGSRNRHASHFENSSLLEACLHNCFESARRVLQCCGRRSMLRARPDRPYPGARGFRPWLIN
jgi:hypothetical protein